MHTLEKKMLTKKEAIFILVSEDLALNLGENCQDYEFMVDPMRPEKGAEKREGKAEKCKC